MSMDKERHPMNLEKIELPRATNWVVSTINVAGGNVPDELLAEASGIAQGIEAQRLLDAQYIADNYVKLPSEEEIITEIARLVTKGCEGTTTSVSLPFWIGTEFRRWLKDRDGG